MAQVLPFNGFYTGSDPKNSARECVNYIPSRHDSGSLSEYTIKSTSGIKTAAGQITDANLEDTIVWNSNITGVDAFGVISTANSFLLAYESVNAIRTVSLLTLTGPEVALRANVTYNSNIIVVLCTTNQRQVIISIDKDLNLLSSTDSTLSDEILDISYIGGRFLYATTGITVYYSDILDPHTIDPLGFFSDLSQNSDNTGIYSDGNRLYLFSASSYSVWVNTPDVNLPFSMQKGSGLNIGLNAKTVLGDSLYFVGVNNGVTSLFRLSGGSVSDIGNEYIRNALSKNYLSFYLFRFYDNNSPIVCIGGDSSTTICYNELDGEFHERKSTNNTTGDYDRWSVFGSESIDSKRIVVFGKKPDSGDILISLVDRSISTEFGDPVKRTLITSPFNSNGVSNVVRELAFQTSIDYSSESPVTLPSLDLSVSKDFGYNYGAVRSKQFDAEGKHDKILRFMNIGFFRQAFVFKIETDTIYPHSILKMLIRLEKGFRQI